MLIFLSTLVDYYAGIYMSKTDDLKKKKLLVLISLFINLGALFFFKYFNFFNTNINFIFSNLGVNYILPKYSILLPVGISFYTFQKLSYTIDVYRGNLKAEKDFITFALYVTFFPQLVAGPIERATNLLKQFHIYHKPSYQRVVSGIRLMTWGFFKKVVIADRLAVAVDTVYNSPTDFDGVYFIIATVLFAFQIFCDFSGYSDIAIGSARIMGYDLMKNFNRPYHSKSITEFWRRWHISLSTWFKDYIYVPLGGNKKGRARTYVNLFIIFFLSGLWHGAKWTFVIWGILNGLAMVFERLIKMHKFTNSLEQRKDLASKSIGIVLNISTFIYICITWIFFRANSVSDAINIIIPKMLTNLGSFSLIEFLNTEIILGLERPEFFAALIALLLMESVHFLESRVNVTEFLYSLPILIRHSGYLLITIMTLWLAWTGNQEFIYFAF